jgi:hypothetical protein
LKWLAPVALIAAPLQSLALALALWHGFRAGDRRPPETA